MRRAPLPEPHGIPAFLVQILPFVAIFAIMYFLIIRPQRQRMKQHQEMVANLRRGDTIVTTGGLIGKVSKVVDDGELQVELSEGVEGACCSGHGSGSALQDRTGQGKFG